MRRLRIVRECQNCLRLGPEYASVELRKRVHHSATHTNSFWYDNIIAFLCHSSVTIYISVIGYIRGKYLHGLSEVSAKAFELLLDN